MFSSRFDHLTLIIATLSIIQLSIVAALFDRELHCNQFSSVYYNSTLILQGYMFPMISGVVKEIDIFITSV